MADRTAWGRTGRRTPPVYRPILWSSSSHQRILTRRVGTAKPVARQHPNPRRRDASGRSAAGSAGCADRRYRCREGGDLDQVVGQDPVSGPDPGAVGAVDPGAVPPVAPFQGTDPTLTPGAPLHRPAERPPPFDGLPGPLPGFPFRGITMPGLRRDLPGRVQQPARSLTARCNRPRRRPATGSAPPAAVNCAALACARRNARRALTSIFSPSAAARTARSASSPVIRCTTACASSRPCADRIRNFAAMP